MDCRLLWLTRSVRRQVFSFDRQTASLCDTLATNKTRSAAMGYHRASRSADWRPRCAMGDPGGVCVRVAKIGVKRGSGRITKQYSEWPRRVSVRREA